LHNGTGGPTTITHLQIPPTPQLEKRQAPEWIGEKLKQLEAQRAKHAPKWWLEWLALNQPKSKIKTGDENAKTTPPPKDKVTN